MLNISAPKDCDNAPKRRFLKDVLVAICKQDFNFLTSHFDESIRWDLVGTKSIEGISACHKTIENSIFNSLEELKIHSIITHGKEGAISGYLVKPYKVLYRFCFLVRFSSAKGKRIKSMSSFVIPIEDASVNNS